MLRDEASVNNFECNSITRQIKYKRRNIGNDKATSYGTSSVPIVLFLFANFVVHRKQYSPGIGCMAHIKSSKLIWLIRCHVIAILQSSAQLSIINNCQVQVESSRNIVIVIIIIIIIMEKWGTHKKSRRRKTIYKFIINNNQKFIDFM